MDGKSFRVLLDVTDLYLENLKYVWINVSPRELKTIYDFKKCLMRKICLEREDIQLFVREGLLLDEETIVVLREDDTVKIKYKSPLFSNLLKESLKEKANSSRKRNINESNINDEEVNSKRDEPEYIALSSDENEYNSDDMKSKKKKRRKQTESSLNCENRVSNLVEKKKKDKKLTVISKNSRKELIVNSENSHKELTVNLENSQSTLTEKKKKQAESSVNLENFHSILTDENHHRKTSNKKKNANKSSITLDQTAADVNFCKDNDVFLSFNSESTSQKQNENNGSSKTTHLDSANVILSSNDSSSKDEDFSYNQNKSSEVIIDLNAEGLSSNNERKKKRKRKRKRKQSLAVFNLSDAFDAMNNFKSFSENAVENVNKHVVYSSPDKNQESNYLGSCELQNPSTDTFVFKDDKSNDIQSLDYPKISTPAQSNNYNGPDFQISLMPNKNSNLSNSENSSISYDKSTTKDTSENNIENKSEKLYEDLPDLTSLPVVGTYIAYKTLELGENYSPTVSDYRVGIVEKTNPETDEIEIKLNQEVIIPARTGRFENLGKDDTPKSIVKRYDTLNWCDIISPKLFNSLPE